MERTTRHAKFFALSLDMLCIAGTDGYFKELNPAWEKTLGFTLAELMAKPYSDFIHPDDRARTAAESERQARGLDAVHFENRYVCKDGSYRWLLWQATPVPSEGRIYAIARDITERKRLEEDLKRSHDDLAAKVRERTAQLSSANAELRAEIAQHERTQKEKERLHGQLIQAQKMEGIGRLAGGVAHDFNNLLTAIGGYCHFLLDNLPPGDPNRDDVAEIQRAGERAAALTRQLLAFSRQQVFALRVLDCNAVVNGLHRMLTRLIGEDVELRCRLGAGLWGVQADPGQLEQVLMNLVVNARDAMPGGGTITIETANVELAEEYARMHMEVEPGPHVLLCVADTGHGMDAGTMERIFEPFFTTKEQGKGTGLGLAVVYGIVKQSGGNIFVYSEPGQGTTFNIYLPRAAEAGTDVAPAPAEAKPAGGPETVLLVEDDELVRKFAQRVLAQNGYTVLAAKTPEEALRACAEHPGPIHLMLTDVVMPQMHGGELARRAAAARPDMKVIYMSGYTETAVVHRSGLGPDAVFLQKPLSPAALARGVRAVLDAG